MIRYIFKLAAIIVFLALLCQPILAKEDTAQISLKKTAVSKQNTHLYKVKKGDVISAIIRRLPGITENDIPDNYRIIKQLNPNVADLNRLYTGQVLVLPGKTSYPAPGKPGEPASDSSPVVATSAAGTQVYKIKKGDNLTTIIHRELKISDDTLKTINVIKSLNPRIADVNKIYAGQILKLPGKIAFVRTAEGAKIIEQEATSPAEAQPQSAKVIPKKAMTQETKLAVIKHIVTQMNGALSASGNYYLPISKTGQVTIDCAKFPVIEFEDKTVVFLDWDNRFQDNLRKMIREKWSNISIVKANKKDDVVTILKDIIAATKAYSISKKETPVTAGSTPALEIVVDWIISGKTTSRQGRLLNQGLRFVSANSLLLPKAVKNYARQNGLIITEIDEETGIADKPEELYSLPPTAVFPTKSAQDFSYALVTYLGFAAEKEADVRVFNMAKDGFNLSIKAEVLLNNAGKKYIIYSRNLPQQFLNAFKTKGYGLIYIADSDSPQIIMEKILSALAIPSAYGYFTFSGPDKNQAPYSFGFTGMKIKTDKDHYVIDFALDDGLRSIIGELWSANIARY